MFSGGAGSPEGPTSVHGPMTPIDRFAEPYRATWFSVTPRPPFLIETRNIAEENERSALKQKMSRQLDQILRERVRPVTLKARNPRKKKPR